MFVKIIRTVTNILSVLMIVLALFVLLSVVMTKPGKAPSVLGYSAFRVLSGSMEPAIQTDSMIVVKHKPAAEIVPGDVISFYSSDPSLNGSINTHRVVSVDQQNGIRIFQTKGDANVVPDEYTATGNDVIGVVVFSSLFLGKLVRLISNPLVFVPIILVPLLALLTLNVIKTIKLARLAAKEEEERQIQAVKDELARRKQARAEAEAEGADPDNSDIHQSEE